MSDDAAESRLREWRGADPQRALAWLFLRRDERVRFGALAALQDEWLKAVHGTSAPQVAAAKLGWWREELARALRGQAHHPLARVLFSDERIREVPASCWTLAVDEALLAIHRRAPADFPAQCESARPLAAAFADLETRIWFGARTRSPRATAVTLFGYLVANLRALDAELGNGRSPIPMNLLARHQLRIDDLSVDCPARRAALHDCVSGLQRGLVGAVGMAGPLGVLRAMQAQYDLRALTRATRADEPLAALRARAHGFADLLKTWRAARTWRDTPIDGEPA